jgi:hypothetical protein
LFEVKEIISFNYVRKSFIDDVTYKLIGDGGEDDWEEVGCFLGGGSALVEKGDHSTCFLFFHFSGVVRV